MSEYVCICPTFRFLLACLNAAGECGCPDTSCPVRTCFNLVPALLRGQPSPAHTSIFSCRGQRGYLLEAVHLGQVVRPLGDCGQTSCRLGLPAVAAKLILVAACLSCPD